MSTRTPAAELVIDNPHADGLLDKHGFAYDWRFEAGKDADAVSAATFQPGWIGEGCELVPALHALGLRGYAVKADMDLAQWSLVAGSYWKTARPAGKPRVKYLFWYDARPDQYGIVLSQAEYEPRVAIWLWRFLPPDGQTLPVFVEVSLHGNGLGPAYTVQIPLHDQQYKFPRLWRHDVGQEDGYLVDEFQRYDAAGLTVNQGAVEQQLWIEETDGVLLLHLSGAAEPWVYQPDDGQGPSRGHISVTFRGHCGLFNLQPIEYPAQGTARPSTFLAVPEWMNQTPSYLPVTGGEGSVVASEDPASGDGVTRPVLTLLRTQPHKRPLVYLLHEYHEPQFSAGDSVPSSTAGQDNLLRLRWCRRMYRGWRFWADLRDFDDAYDWRGNEKVTVKAGWDTAAEQVMVGYLAAPARRRDGREHLGRPLAEVEGHDYIAARLAGRKFMAWHGSPVGWNFAQWFSYVLQRAGVPEALISVEDDGYVIESLPAKWHGRYEFSPDTPVLTALDEVVRSRGWVWGINKAGQIWTGPRPEYSGTADFVLDDSTATEEDRIHHIAAERAADDFRNYVAVFTGGPYLDAAIWHDESSHRDPEAAAFIGDDWWDVLVAPDASDPALVGWQIFYEARQWRCDLVWETLGKPGLTPGKFVEVRVDGLGVPEGAVFQIIEDRGIMDRARGLFRSLFLARAVDV